MVFAGTVSESVPSCWLELLSGGACEAVEEDPPLAGVEDEPAGFEEFPDGLEELGGCEELAGGTLPFTVVPGPME